MKIDENWYKLYEKLYGTDFNRILTVGTPEMGYTNYDIKNIDDIKKLIDEKTLNHEFFISLFNYAHDERLITWKQTDITRYEKYADKNCVLFRFKQNTDIIREEVADMNEVQKFMFIRRSINLGSNKNIVNECKRTCEFFEKNFDIKPMLMFNGYDECLLYLFTDYLLLEEGSLTCHALYEILEEELELETLFYRELEPYAQLVPLPGTQISPSRLYIQIFSPDKKYREIMKNSENKFLDLDELNNVNRSEKFEEFLSRLDDVVSNNNSRKPDYLKVLKEYINDS